MNDILLGMGLGMILFAVVMAILEHFRPGREEEELEIIEEFLSKRG